MSDFSITERKKYIASFVICESETPLIAARATAQQVSTFDQRFEIGVTVDEALAAVLFVRDGNGLRNTNGPIVIPAGGPRAFVRYTTVGDLGYSGYNPYVKAGLIEFSPVVGLGATASGDEIKVIFPTGGAWDDDSVWRYELVAGGGVLATGLVTVARSAAEPEDDDDDSDSTFQVCNFSVAPAA
ncbi:MAG: hypothetical protein ACO3O3_13220 [Ilumatobacteraceae bacterium]